MLLAGVDQRFVQNGAMSPNDTAVTVDHEPKRVVENILRVLPGTKTVFVVVGASHLFSPAVERGTGDDVDRRS